MTGCEWILKASAPDILQRKATLVGDVRGGDERLMGTGPGPKVSGFGVWDSESFAVPGA